MAGLSLTLYRKKDLAGGEPGIDHMLVIGANKNEITVFIPVASYAHNSHQSKWEENMCTQILLGK